jgi:concanavalin A-like lectin/glucanase superfamily protein
MKRPYTLFVAAALAFTVHAQPAYVPLNGLVAWYGLNGSAVDESGQDHDGIVATPTLSNDRCGAPDGSYYFDGDDHIELADTDTLGTTAFSVSAWARFSGITSPLAVVSKHVNFSQNGFGMGIQNDQVLFAINNGGPTQVGSALQYGDSIWHLLTATYDGDSMVLYVDTVVVGAMGGVAPPNATAMNVRIGKDSDLAAFLGGIDEVGLWSRALEPAEVAQLYEECSTAAVAELPSGSAVHVLPSVVRAGGTVEIMGPAGGPVPYTVLDADGRVAYSGTLTNGRALLTMDRTGLYLVHTRGAVPARIVVH